MKHRYRKWSGFFALLAMLSLIWWQQRMIDTGSSLDYGRIRWIFSVPFYSFVIMTSISGALHTASFFSHKISQLTLVILFGLCLPSALIWLLYRGFNFERWAMHGQWEFRLMLFVQFYFLYMLTCSLLNFVYQTIAQLFLPAPPHADD